MPRGNAKVSKGGPRDGPRGARSRVAQKVLSSPFQGMSNRSLRIPCGSESVASVIRKIAESAENDTSSGRHVDGGGKALVFALKTSLRLKTGGLVYRPVSGR